MTRQTMFAMGIGALLGGLLIGSIPLAPAETPDLFTSSVDTEGKYTVATGKILNREGDALYLFNHEKERLAVYLLDQNKLSLLHVRNCEYDFRVDEFSAPGRKSIPPVAEMRKKLEEKP